jgi:hypothetical protein
MNLGQLRDRAQQRFRDTGGLIIGTTTWNEHLNFAYREFLRAGRWPFTTAYEDLDVNAGTRRVDLESLLGAGPPDAAEVLSGLENIYNITDDTLVQPFPVRGMAWRLRRHLENQSPGQPAFWEVVGADIVLVPPPITSVTLRFYYFDDPPELTLDADVPVIPLRYQESIVTGAVAKAHEDDQNRESADKYKKEFDQIVAQAVAELIPGQTEAVNMMAATSLPLEDTGLSADRR